MTRSSYFRLCLAMKSILGWIIRVVLEDLTNHFFKLYLTKVYILGKKIKPNDNLWLVWLSNRNLIGKIKSKVDYWQFEILEFWEFSNIILSAQSRD